MRERERKHDASVVEVGEFESRVTQQREENKKINK